MKITPEMRVLGPVFLAQYTFVYGAGAEAPNPYEVGTQSHTAFMEQMIRLEAESVKEFDDPTPYGLALTDFIEGIEDNPYNVGSADFESYEMAMEEIKIDSEGRL